MKRLLPLVVGALCLGTLSLPAARAAILVDFSSEGDSTRVNISGSLDTSGLSFGSPLSFGSLNMKSGELWFTAAPGNYRFASHSLPVANWHSLNVNGLSYSDVSGVDFGFNDMSIAVPSGYVSGSALSASFRIDGMALDTINPQAGVVMTLGNGDTISVSVAPVPEPAVASLVLATVGLVLIRRLPRRARFSLA